MKASTVKNFRVVGRALVVICWVARFAPAQQPACQPIEADRILARDLAVAAPAFGRIPADTWLANAPQPGSRRILHAAELASLAQRYAIHPDVPLEVCFEWAMEPLHRDGVIEAMREALQDPAAQIEIAELSVNPVPRGRLEFPRERLGTPATSEQRDPVLWRGDVIYGGDHRYAVWARVRVKTRCEKLVAKEGLKQGHPIAAEQLRVEEGECFPGGATMSKDRVAGMMPLRAIPAGAEVRAAWLTSPYDVTRGDLVEVEVHSGAARLRFSAKAESDGRVGDSIAIRNPESNRIFQARVNGKDRATVQADFAKGN